MSWIQYSTRITLRSRNILADVTQSLHHAASEALIVPRLAAV